jgi:hypothetical protein
LISLKETASSILHTFYKTQRSESEEEQKHIIIETAAKLIQREIFDVKVSKEYYPSFAEVSSADKKTLILSQTDCGCCFNIFPGKDIAMKTAAIGQALMQAYRPRVLMSPLQVGLGVHHYFALRYFLD